MKHLITVNFMNGGIDYYHQTIASGDLTILIQDIWEDIRQRYSHECVLIGYSANYVV